MPRSPRAQSFLIATLAVLLLVTGAAFVGAFGSQLTWQQRDAVTASAAGYAVETADGTPTVRLRLTVENPLDRPVEIAGSELVVYEGDPPFEDDDRLTVPRSSTVPDATVAAADQRTVTVSMTVDGDAVERARTAVADGSASASGVIEMRLAGREFDVDV